MIKRTTTIMSVSDIDFAKTPHELFEEQVRRQPQSIALIDRSCYLSCDSLNREVNKLARYLIERGISMEDRVGIYMKRSIQAVIAVMAVLKTGAIYIPLDIGYPTVRLRQIVEDTKPLATLVTNDVPFAWLAEKSVLINVDESANHIGTYSAENIPCFARPDSAAYVLYTSGTTGRPKAVVGIHQSITNGLRALPFDQHLHDDVCCLNVSLSLAFSLSRLFPPLLLGVPLFILPDSDERDPWALGSSIEREGISSLGIVPSFLNEIVHDPSLVRFLSRLRTLVVSGSRLTPQLLAATRSCLASTRILQRYGTTEIGCPAFVWAFHPDSWKDDVGGEPVSETWIHILDEDMNPAAVGTVGEIYVSAPHLARGYLNQPALTAERFLPNPFSTHPGGRFYRTGDLGRQSPNGKFEILGRKDDLIKLRGYTVAPIEIEIALSAHHAVQEVVVQKASQGESLIAYVVPLSGLTVSPEELRGYLEGQLPEHLIPSAFEILDQALPRHPNGKLDRESLPALPLSKRSLLSPYLAPRDETEGLLVAIEEEVLKLHRIGIRDNFLLIGGDSLLAVRILSRLSDRTGVHISLQEFFDNLTIEELSSNVLRRRFRSTDKGKG